METTVINEEQENPNSWKINTLLIGAGLGALTGLFAAYLIIQRAERAAVPPKITAGDGVKLGMSVLTMLRSVTDLAGRAGS